MAENWDIVERYKDAEPDLQLRVIRTLILQVIGSDGDSKLPLEMVQLLIEAYQAECRKAHHIQAC